MPTSPTDSLYTIVSSFLMYGSSRLGVVDAKQSGGDGNNHFSRKLRAKEYELTDHLGNVVATVSDKKIHPQELVVGGQHNVDTTLSFQADLTSRTDYYPFGMEIQSRSGNYTNIDYSADVNKLLYSGLLSKCNNYEAIIQNPQPGLNVLINCQTAQNVYGQDYVDALQIEDHTGGLNFDLNMNINLSEIIPSLESDGDYVIELSMLGTHEREVTAHIGGVLGVISSPSHPDGGNLIPADDKVVTFSLKGSDLQALATNNQILLNLTFIFHGGTNIIELQNLKVFQVFEGYSVPLAKRMEKGYGYGYQGSEKDSEVKGSGNHYTTYFRQLDVRLGKWWSVDPKSSVSPSVSPFAVNGNNPILMIDPLGDKEYESKKAYRKETGNKWKDRGQGDWLTSDRTDNTDAWKGANEFNLQQENGFNEYTSISQRADFYGWFQSHTDSKGFDTKWAGAASEVANGIDMLTWEVGGLTDFLGYSSEEARSFANTGNEMIFNDAFPKLRNLVAGEVKVGQAAFQWDALMLSQEQNLIQPLYENTSSFGLLSGAAKQRLAFSSWLAPVKPFPRNGNLMNVGQRWSYGMGNMGYGVKPANMPNPGAGYTNGTMYRKFRRTGAGGSW